jgi:type I restriction enzyme M protein
MPTSTHGVRSRARRSRPLKTDCNPKEVIRTLAEDLLGHYADRPLIDAYDVYQHLMDYWDETIQDDVYLIAADGWKAETHRVLEVRKGKDGKPGKEIDRGWACDLIPKPLIVARYFAKEQEAIDALSAELEGITARLAELEEEQGGEEGAFSPLDKVNKASVSERLKEIKGDKALKDEATVLNNWLTLNASEADLKRRIKDAEAALDKQSHAKYARLTENEIKALVVDNKWLDELDSVIHGEMDRVSQEITQRVKELGDRYEVPLPHMLDRVKDLEARVSRHLERMGFAWS